MATPTAANRAREAMGITTPAAAGPTSKDTAIVVRTQELVAMREQFQRALPKGREAEQLIRDAVTALRLNDDLWKCTKASFFGGLMTAAQLALRVGVLGHGWLIPFENRQARSNDGTQVFEAQWVIGYQGMIELVQRTGVITGISARIIHANEKYRIAFGSNEGIEHEPIFNDDKGAPIIYYAQAWMTNGGYQFHPEGRKEMLEFRNGLRGAGRKSSPWQTNFDAMALKTCVRRLYTYLPKTDLIAAAIENDGATVELHGEELVQTSAASEPQTTPAAALPAEAATQEGGGEFLSDEEQDAALRRAYEDEVAAGLA